MKLYLFLFLVPFVVTSYSHGKEGNTLSNEVLPNSADAKSSKLADVPQAVATRSNLVTILLASAAAISIGILIMVALYQPFFAYKLCHLTGSCDQVISDYIDQYILKQQQRGRTKRSEEIFDVPIPLEATTKSPKSRSLEKVAPLMQMLAVAYDNYLDGVEKKSSEKSGKSSGR